MSLDRGDPMFGIAVVFAFALALYVAGILFDTGSREYLSEWAFPFWSVGPDASRSTRDETG